MKAARIHRFGPPDVIVIDDLAPRTAAAGQVLLRVASAGVGPWYALIRENRSVVNSPLPLTLGSDLSGILEAVGPGVTKFKPGDEVYGVTNPESIGVCARVSQNGRTKARILEPHRAGFGAGRCRHGLANAV